jgi:hypothetical protein
VGSALKEHPTAIVALIVRRDDDAELLAPLLNKQDWNKWLLIAVADYNATRDDRTDKRLNHFGREVVGIVVCERQRTTLGE